MSNIKLITNTERCTGCGACATICPNKCISLSYNKGFLLASINADNCINCGICLRYCPQHKSRDNSINNYSTQYYSSVAKNKDLVRRSSSGGTAGVIIEHYRNLGYTICGAVYNSNNNRIEHIATDRKETINRMRGSKYLQSNSQINITFEVDKKYLFIGTPCQVAGVESVIKYRKLDRNNFVLIDLFCFGVPSYNLWDSYIKQYIKGENICNVNFRSKIYGWHSYTLEIEDETGVYYSDQDKDKDPFFYFFKRGLCLNSPCYECKYRGDNSFADIRLGDFWGESFQHNNEGVNLVLAITPLGKEILRACSDELVICEYDMSTALAGQVHKDKMKPRNWNSILNKFNTKTLSALYHEDVTRTRIKSLCNKLLGSITHD